MKLVVNHNPLHFGNLKDENRDYFMALFLVMLRNILSYHICMQVLCVGGEYFDLNIACIGSSTMITPTNRN